MKRYIGVFLTLITAAAVILFSACSSNEKNNQLKNIERPDTAATGDEAVEATAASDAVELSENVNGVRFNLSLHGFTQKYNAIIKGKQGAILLKDAKWKKAGDAATDDNDVKIQYWYYDDENVSFTATEELASGKLVNIGVGTTMSKFMGMTDDENNSDRILEQAAWMAEAACGFAPESESVLQDIFYRTTTENNDTLWYCGYVFHLSTKEDKADFKSNIMQFRVFPITEALRDEWKLEEYKG